MKLVLTACLLQREGQVAAGVMTTSTHTGEEKEEEDRKGVCVSHSAVLRDPEHRAHIIPIPHFIFFPRQPTRPPFSHVNEGIPQAGTFLSVSQLAHKISFYSHLTFPSILLCFIIFLGHCMGLFQNEICPIYEK